MSIGKSTVMAAFGAFVLTGGLMGCDEKIAVTDSEASPVTKLPVETASKDEDCALCVAQMNPFEKVVHGNRTNTASLMADIFQGDYLDYYGRSGLFCSRLEDNGGLTLEAVRDTVRATSDSVGLGLRPGGTADPGPAEGLVALMLCQSFLNEKTEAAASAYRILGYLDLKVAREGSDEDDVKWRKHALEVLGGSVGLDRGIAAYLQRQDIYNEDDFDERVGQTRRASTEDFGYENFVKSWEGDKYP